MQAEAAGIPGTERSAIVAALKNAAAATGSDFHYLLGTAIRESSLRPQAQSATSSAAGLFQFIDQTWLGLVKEHGARHGLAAFADAITKDAGGRYHAEPGAKQSILALRKDPQLSALMAGEYARTTQGAMQASLGRAVCGGELYAAHFLGPDAACKLIRLAASDPGASAAAQFPQAAGANKSVFYRPDGQPRSVREVYDWAMAQPGGADTVRVATLPDITPPRAPAVAATSHDADIQMLLASVMNWQSGQSLSNLAFSGGLSANPFGGLFSAGMPGATLSFAPGLLSLLSDSKDPG